jgi:exodeoxyribonuclease-3
MERLRLHAAELLKLEERLVLAGDYNVIPNDDDVKTPADWMGDALFQPETRAAWRALQWLGLTEAYETADGRPHGYTFWDYQAGAWQRNNGIRIDHALLSPQAAERLKGVTIHKAVRAREKPSDHVPFEVELAL